MEAQILQSLQRRHLRSPGYRLAHHCLVPYPPPFVPLMGAGWNGEEAGSVDLPWSQSKRPCPLLDAGFWRSKFDPNLTQRGTFHLDEQFTVPVDMMQALTYPLHWFLLEQPEIQVTLDCSGQAWVLGGGEGTV